jgi:hypothetical protein
VKLASALALFIAATYVLRAIGVLVPAILDDLEDWTQPLTAAILASLVVTSTFTAQGALVIDIRLVGLGIAVVTGARRWPLPATLLAAMTCTAVVRLFT